MQELNCYYYEPEVLAAIDNYCLIFSVPVVFEVTYTVKRGDLSRPYIFIEHNSMTDELKEMLQEHKVTNVVPVKENLS